MDESDQVCSGDRGGDPALAPIPPTPPAKGGSLSAPAGRREATAGAGHLRGKFWVLADPSDDEEETAAGAPVLQSSEEEEQGRASPRRRPSPAATLEDYIQRAEELGGSLRHRRRRRAFAPGGRPARPVAAAAARFWRLGDAGRVQPSRSRGVAPSVDAQGGSPALTGLSVRAAPPEARAETAARVPGELAVSGGAVCPGLAGPGPGAQPSAEPDAQLSADFILGCPTGFEGGLLEPVTPSPLKESERVGPLGGLRPTAPGPARRVRYKWLWLPSGCPIPSLGFPARASEVRRRLQDPLAPPHRLLRRIPPPSPTSRSFADALMDRGGDEGRKRRLDEPGRRAGDAGYGRRSGGGRVGGGGGRQEGGGSGDGDWPGREGGWRQDQGRVEAGYRYQDGDQGYRYVERGREDWDAPPPRWREQQRWEEARDAPPQGDREGFAGQGDRGPRAKVKGKKISGGGAGAAAQKGKNKAGQAKAGAPAAGECFKCGREGHYQSECQFEPLCVICSGEGHASASCPSRGKAMRLQSMGHAITGGGFYNIDVEPLGPGQGGARESFAAVIKFKDEPLPEDKLTEELKLLVDDLWDWQVARQSASEFTVVFPSRATLRLAIASGKLFLPLSEKETEIREAFLAPKPSLVLPSTWVRLTGVPEDLMTKERLMAAFVMVGRPIDVDELSILKHDREPIRIRFQGRYPERMKGSVQVFVNGEGYTVSLQTEAEPRGGAGGSNGGPPPPPRQDRDDVDSDEMSSDDEWNKHRKKSAEQEKEKGKDKGLDTGKGPGQSGARKAASQSAPPASKVQGGSLDGMARPIDQYGTNLGLALGLDAPVQVGLVADKETVKEPGMALGLGLLEATEGSMVSMETDSQVTDPIASWVAESPSMGGPPSKIARMGSPAREAEVDTEDWVVTDSEEEGGARRDLVLTPASKKDLVREAMVDTPLVQGKRSLAIPYARKKKKEMVTAVRKSGRHGGAGAGTSTLAKAQRLAAEKNLESTKDKAKGTDFSILDVLPDSHLSSVVRDSCLLFHPKTGVPGEALSLIRAKEAVQAALAETRHRLEAEAAARRAEADAKAAEESGPAGEGTPAPDGTLDVAPGEATCTGAACASPPVVGLSGRPRRKCTQSCRPVLTVRKGQTKRKGSR
ncbi:hypothetical protein QYE76_054780 [Lolium multiflorum]|uniref:CCHC-type domain-containing protein n=1 Tax=Lolium multiflorum TaxID=4521 RepID=A0AAD8SZS7_LOLMU|nr:hypothetical protein QYE76_054780 [Lolium multiflorum]